MIVALLFTLVSITTLLLVVRASAWIAKRHPDHDSR